jgi:hypothetical protein
MPRPWRSWKRRAARELADPAEGTATSDVHAARAVETIAIVRGQWFQLPSAPGHMCSSVKTTNQDSCKYACISAKSEQSSACESALAYSLWQWLCHSSRIRTRAHSFARYQPAVSRLRGASNTIRDVEYARDVHAAQASCMKTSLTATVSSVQNCTRWSSSATRNATVASLWKKSA